MTEEFENVQNPMLGGYLIWRFVKGFFSNNNEYVALDLLYIVLPMTLREERMHQIKTTNRVSGMRIMASKFMKRDILKNDLLADLHKDIGKMMNLTALAISEALKSNLISIDIENNKVFPLVVSGHNSEASEVVKLGDMAEKLGYWCADLELEEIEEVLKVRF